MYSTKIESELKYFHSFMSSPERQFKKNLLMYQNRKKKKKRKE